MTQVKDIEIQKLQLFGNCANDVHYHHKNMTFQNNPLESSETLALKNYILNSTRIINKMVSFDLGKLNEFL